MRIKNEEEAKEISGTLLREMNAFMNVTNSLNDDGGSIRGGDLFNGYITDLGAAFLLPADQGAKALTIAINPSNRDPETVPAFFAAMSGTFRIHYDKNHCPTCFTFDLKTHEGRRNWGLAGFYFWNKRLSSEARGGMNLISGSDYRIYLPLLRGLQGPPKNPREIGMVRYLYQLNDAIMEDGRIPQEATLYRAIKDQKLAKVWDELSVKSGEVDVSDGAFAFTSLDENFVETWFQTQLRGDGVILEIHAPAGLPAGYVEPGGYKDNAEIVLPMNAPLVATHAFLDSKGRKRLKVEYRPFKLAR